MKVAGKANSVVQVNRKIDSMITAMAKLNIRHTWERSHSEKKNDFV